MESYPFPGNSVTRKWSAIVQRVCSEDHTGRSSQQGAVGSASRAPRIGHPIGEATYVYVSQALRNGSKIGMLHRGEPSDKYANTQ